MNSAPGAPVSLFDPPPQRIAVFRALQLGDMLCAVPALRALRAAAPQAHITLIGLPGAAGFVQRYRYLIDELLSFPGWAGLPEQPVDADAWPTFMALARARRFDLAIQLHGTGGIVNDLLATLGARHHAGFYPPGEAPPGAGFIPWPDHLPEILRYTALLEHLGAPAATTDLDFPLMSEDLAGCDALIAHHGLRPAQTVIIHPGARLRSRRWGAPRFGVVARTLAGQGWDIAITGTADEADLTRQVHDAVPQAHDLTQATSLGVLAALVARCRLVVCNDTGMSHIAAAMHTPSVVIASGSDVHRWAPLDAQRHPVLWRPMPCRPCAHERCPMRGHPCASLVEADAVLAQANIHLHAEPAHA